jgi:hypothetical protein
MLYHDADSRLQLARERADELARDYRRAQKHDADAARQRPERLAHVLNRLRRTRLERRPAYRA